MAGINSALFVQQRESFRLRRNESYTGVLIDDLITQGVDEPYRIFTSRAEYRLALRHDNADARLEPYGRDLGLIGDGDWERFNAKRDRIAEIRKALQTTRLKRSDPRYAAVQTVVGSDLGDSITLEQLSQRPGVTTDLIANLLSSLGDRPGIRDLESALADGLYSGYIQTQRNAIERLNHHDTLRIPSELAYSRLDGLSREMAERLERTRPMTFGEARKVPGLTPAALSLILVELTSKSAKVA